MGYFGFCEGLLMPLSQTLKDQVDPVIDDLVTQLTSIQSTYKTANNKYWQGIDCVPILPADGTSQSADLTVKPTDQVESWNDELITLTATLPVRLQVHTYNGPLGHGYDVVGTVKSENEIWSRCVSVGLETRSYDWKLIETT